MPPEPEAVRRELTKARTTNADAIKAVRADWQHVVLVCRKCTRKLDGRGFGAEGRQSLAKALGRAANGKAKVKPREARLAVIEVDCLKVCPKNAVMAVNARTPQDWVIVPAGTPLPRILDRLDLAGLVDPDGAGPVENEPLSD